jgi:hypothetical protein
VETGVIGRDLAEANVSAAIPEVDTQTTLIEIGHLMILGLVVNSLPIVIWMHPKT